MSKFKSKELKEKCYFLLYDSEDNVTYLDNWNELSKYINYKIYDLTKEFNRHNSNFIRIIIDNHFYMLFVFND